VANWSSPGAFAQNFNFSRVTHLNLAFKNINASGDLPAMTVGEKALRDSAHNNGVKFFLSLGGAGIDPIHYHNNMNDPIKRANLAKKLKDYAIANNLDGLDLDLEGNAINNDFAIFMGVIADTMHAHNKLLSAALGALNEGYGSATIPNATLAKLDWLNIMAYDQCGPTWGTPGQHSSYSLAQNAINYWKSRGLPASKCILGVPFYGYGFGAAASPYGYTFNYIATTYPSNVYLDEAGNTIYYNGIFTIIDKTTLAMQQAGGIMIWELTQDAQGNNSLLRAIANTSGITSIQENSKNQFALTIYPNPAEDLLNIQCAESNFLIEIHNYLGETVYTAYNVNTIPLTSFARGLYIVTVTSENKKYIQSIIIQ
jgi:GH18 family chitinase